MSLDWANDVLAFHQKFGIAVGTTPCLPKGVLQAQRTALLEEELRELRSAATLEDYVDAHLDLISVLLGNLIAAGIPPVAIERMWNEVTSTNMAKERGSDSNNSKPTKPVGWQPPDLQSIIQSARDGEIHFDGKD